MFYENKNAGVISKWS